MLSFYFEIDMKTAILRVILKFFKGEKYLSTGNLFTNNYWNPQISIYQTKFIFMENVLECLNNTNVPVKNIPQMPKIQQKELTIRAVNGIYIQNYKEGTLPFFASF